MSPQGNQARDQAVPLGFGSVIASVGDHIAHFYHGSSQMFNILEPYVAEGIRRGDKCVVISSPDVGEKLQNRLSSYKIDVEQVSKTGQLVLHPGESNQESMRSLVERIEDESLNAGYKFVRWVGDGGWALAGRISVHEMLCWEALYDKVSRNWKMLALCQFDLQQFNGDVVMDALRSHPLCIMGETLVPNPFHVSPGILLQELSEREI